MTETSYRTHIQKHSMHRLINKNAQKHTKNRELSYHFSKGHFHTCDYSMHEWSKMCLAPYNTV